MRDPHTEPSSEVDPQPDTDPHQEFLKMAFSQNVADERIDASSPLQFPSAAQLNLMLDAYAVKHLIDTGGMGAVYLARHIALDRNVAIKLPFMGVAPSADVVARFEAEARNMAKLDHPHVVRIFDSGSEPFHYLVMELVDGVTLQEMIEPCKALPYKEASQIILQVCDGLAAAHAAEVVHRDVKPSNIFIDSEGNAKVGDFGISKSLQHAQTMLGTHMSPEQVSGTPFFSPPPSLHPDPDDQVTYDIYSWGFTFYRMLTGAYPVGSWKPASHIKGVPKGIDAVIEKCLQQDPKDRFSSMAELRSALMGAEKFTIDRRGVMAGVIGTVAAGGAFALIRSKSQNSGQTRVEPFSFTDKSAARWGELSFLSDLSEGVISFSEVGSVAQVHCHGYSIWAEGKRGWDFISTNAGVISGGVDLEFVGGQFSSMCLSKAGVLYNQALKVGMWDSDKIVQVAYGNEFAFGVMRHGEFLSYSGPNAIITLPPDELFEGFARVDRVVCSKHGLAVVSGNQWKRWSENQLKMMPALDDEVVDVIGLEQDFVFLLRNGQIRVHSDYASWQTPFQERFGKGPDFPVKKIKGGGSAVVVQDDQGRWFPYSANSDLNQRLAEPIKTAFDVDVFSEGLEGECSAVWIS
ncbi:MAG: serine/threonine-protein kinase [Verrucomicrobiota bacterium]